MLESKVKDGTLNDIAGSRFSVGPQASGTEQSTLVILRGVNMSKKIFRRNTWAMATPSRRCVTVGSTAARCPPGCRPPR
ncbi:Uncharacterised protein [Serratia rubidaea]|uniref:Uncharacterized protein n=1 Tax=Serratia rubidaea TaxID=61652 RepID=A0A3S4I3S6_SERRU|nr:Uncharacterised protein [Serratia rubidaea]